MFVDDCVWILSSQTKSASWTASSYNMIIAVKWQQLLSPREEVVLEGAKSGEVGGCYLRSNRHPWMAAITAVDLAMSQTY